MADALSVMMDKAVEKNLIVGVLESVIEKGISHIQYANDTVLMTDGSDESITNLKIILYCFEWLSGLKINYHKMRSYFWGLHRKRRKGRQTCLIVSLGSFQLSTWGILVSDKALQIGAFQGLVNRVNKILDPWKGKFMTSGGKLIFIKLLLEQFAHVYYGFLYATKRSSWENGRYKGKVLLARG